ncbi:MAG: hypothetical protein LUD51_08230 [Clostridia bacterium]|nr:hypothetical protein [Clostridia bacterium]
MEAYDEEFVDIAMDTLGEALDYAVRACGLGPDEFFSRLISSGIAHQIECGNTKYVCGMSGTELAREVLFRTDAKTDFPPVMVDFPYTDIYWAGWILAYSQWQTCRTFQEIRRYVSVKDVIDMYYPLHEAPESKFVDVLEAIIARKESGDSQ